MDKTNNSTCAISIVMPTYNAEQYLKETLKSVQNQSFKDWEVIIVDDGSTDTTMQIASDYALADHNISVQQLDQNSGGPARPRNVGVSLAKGTWIAFLDADDLWHPEKLRHQLNAVTQAGQSFSCTGLKNFTQSDAIDFFNFQAPSTTHIGYVRQRFRTAIANSSVMIKRDIAATFPFEENRGFRAVEDYHCWLRVLASGETCVKLNAPYLAYRVSDGQISAGKWSQTKKVFMVHQSLPMAGLVSFVLSGVFTVTHVLGAIFSRVLLGRM